MPLSTTDPATQPPTTGDDGGRLGRDLGGDEAPSRALAWLLLAAGVLGVLAAGVLTVEKIALLTDSSYVPSCSLNPVLNCGSIMRTDQAEVFGFPNPLLGLAAFPLLSATGLGLLAGARFRRWYWLGLQAGVTLGAAFVVWLVFQSLYRINALCPYCMVVWAVVAAVFWTVTAHNTRTGVLGERLRTHPAGHVLVAYSPTLVSLTVVVVLVLATQRFWDYWVTLV